MLKATVEATEKITTVDGQKVRVWNGVTEGGVKFLMFVARVAVATDQDPAEFERALRDMPAPRELATRDVFDLRKVL